MLRAPLLLFVALVACSNYAAEPAIDAAFPGGNILVEKFEGDTFFVRQDLRDTEGDWFYWCFRVRGAAGKTLTFTFTGSDVIGVRGPAMSRDGKEWKWLGRENVKGKSFSHHFDADAGDVYFAMGIPYVEKNLKDFLAKYSSRTELKTDVLCKSQKGRETELLHVGRLDGNAAHRVVLTARHHACEMMADYQMEGMIEQVLADNDSGKWLRENVEFLIVPFMDKDGVESGDQGKNRKPHDHNRDYLGESLYPSVAALKKLLPEWAGGNLRIALDMHCPGIRGHEHEVIHFVGGPGEGNWFRVGRLSKLLEKVQQGPLVFSEKDNLPFGKSWNTLKDARSFGRWAESLPGVNIASTIEIPFANAGGKEVTAESARAFGRDLARAMAEFLKGELTP